MDSPGSFCVARVTGAGVAASIAATLAALGRAYALTGVSAATAVDAAPAATSEDAAVAACRAASATTIVLRAVAGGPTYLGCGLPAGGGDARTLAELLRRAVEGGPEPLPDAALDQWAAAVRARTSAAAARHWRHVGSLLTARAPDPSRTAPSPDGPGLDRRWIAPAAARRLDERYAAGGEASVHAFAAACWLVAAQRASSGTVHAVATATDRRTRAELRRVLGRTHRWLPLVEHVDPGARFATLERAVAASREAGIRWLERLPDDLPVLATGLDAIVFEPATGAGATCEIVDAGGWAGDLPLTLRLVRADGRWWLDVSHGGAAPDPLLAGWTHLLATAAADHPVTELALAAADPSARPFATLSGGAEGGESGGVTEPVDVVEAVDRWRARRPDDVAIVDGDGPMTVDELWRQAGELAAGLPARDLVAIRGTRDRAFVVGVLAVLRVGGCFVPIDATADDNRARAAGAQVLLAGGRIELLSSVPPSGGAGPAPGPGGGRYAYGMWTSGSLGLPKLVLISRATLAAATTRVAAAVGIGPSDRYLHLASFGFSSSVRQLFVPLTRGATVLLADDRSRTDVDALLDWLARVRPTVIDTTPTTLDAVAAESPGPRWPASVRLVLAASEYLSPAVARRFRETTGYSGPLLHMYGATETSGLVAGYGTDTGEGAGGYPLCPLPGARLLVRDAFLHPLPAGMEGELYVQADAGGDCYASAAATAAAFVPAPGAPGARMFRTRDRARWYPDGTLAWVGRADDLIKVRGERVSLTHVAELAQAHPSVARAVAVDIGGEVRVAVAAARGTQLSVTELRDFLRVQPLAAGLPTRVVLVDQLPRNASGKIDRSAVRDLLLGGEGDRRAPATAAATTTEIALLDLWAAVLPGRMIGVTDDFFELGGHSLKAAQLAARVRRGLAGGGRFGVSAVFEHPTIRSMAKFLDAAEASR